ncbi:hypothetical protein V7S79_02150 [Aquirufa sp. ROCK-SH2]
MRELNSDQFSFKNLIVKGLLIIPYVKRNYKRIIIGGFIGFIVGISVEFYRSNDKKFKSEVVFLLDNDKVSSGGLSDLASTLGLGDLNGSNSNLFSGENFKELFKTRNLLRKAILTKVKLGNREDLYGNLFLEKCDLFSHEWKYYPDHIQNFKFKNADLKTISQEDKAILDLIGLYLKNNSELKNENPKSTFQTLTIETRNDTLSYLWAKLYLNTLADFYISNKNKKSNELLEILDKRKDSLKTALYYTQGKLANYTDQNQQIIFQRARIIADRLQMNSTQLQTMYLEAVRNYDNLKFSLVKETPLFNLISEPELPGDGFKYKWGPVTLIATLIGIALSIFIQYTISVYKELMA